MARNTTLEMARIRYFIAKRPWFHNGREPLVTEEEYQKLLDGKLALTKKRRVYLLAFIDGWTRAKK